MKSFFPAIIFPFLFAVLASCSDKPTSPALLEAECLLETDPDSAFVLASTAPEPDDVSDRALRTLVIAFSSYRMDRPLPPDSALGEAARRFDDISDRPRLMKTLFTLGRSRYAAGDLAGATDCALRAYDMSVTLSDDCWRARTAELLEDIADSSMNFEETASRALEAAEFYGRAGLPRNQRYLLCDYAYALGNLLRYERAYTLLDSVVSLASGPEPDSALMAYAYKVRFQLLADDRRFVQADSLFPVVRQLSRFNALTSRDYTVRARGALELGRTDSVLPALDRALSLASGDVDSALVFYAFSRYHRAAGQVVAACDALDSVLMVQNRALARALSRDAVKAQRDYFDREAESSRRRASTMTLVVIVVSGFAAILIVGGVLVYRLRARARRAEIRCLVSDFEAVSAELRSRQTENSLLAENVSALSADVATLLHERWESLHRLCNEYAELAADSDDYPSLRRRIRATVTSLRRPELVREIAGSVDRGMDSVLTRITQQCPFISSADLDMIALFLAGFSPRAVAFVLDIKPWTVYKRRSRLIERISSSEAPDRDDFVHRLS